MAKIKWDNVIRKDDGIKNSIYLSEDGRFEIKMENSWYLYDNNTPDKRWFRHEAETLHGAQCMAERILEEEQNGNNPYCERE